MLSRQNKPELFFYCHRSRMLMKIAVAFLLAVAALVFPFIQGQIASVVFDDCLSCMCYASSKCNLTFGCTSGQQILCGPYLISPEYWTESGKPVLANDNPDRGGAYQACTQDLNCAKKTIRSYMEKFAQDCNGDGVINCDDFSHLHAVGALACFTPPNSTLFYQGYIQCRDQIRSLLG